MKGVGKIEVVLSWDDSTYCCRFKRGRHTENWNEMSRVEQVRAVGAMMSMAKMFSEHIKEAD